MWLLNSSCKEVVVLAWGNGSEFGVKGDILRKVESVGRNWGNGKKMFLGV